MRIAFAILLLLDDFIALLINFLRAFFGPHSLGLISLQVKNPISLPIAIVKYLILARIFTFLVAVFVLDFAGADDFAHTALQILKTLRNVGLALVGIAHLFAATARLVVRVVNQVFVSLTLIASLAIASESEAVNVVFDWPVVTATLSI